VVVPAETNVKPRSGSVVEATMHENRAGLIREFKQRLRWIALLALLAAFAAVGMLALTGPITVNLALAVILGVVFTSVIGAGLFATLFFSARGGYDEAATHTLVAEDEPQQHDTQER
jgi:flagellar basal body-associated protein FliL